MLHGSDDKQRRGDAPAGVTEEQTMVLRWNVAEKRREVGEAQCVGKQGASEQPVRISWMGWLAGPALSQKNQLLQ